MNKEKIEHLARTCPEITSHSKASFVPGFLAGFDAGVKHAEEWISVEDVMPDSDIDLLVCHDILQSQFIAFMDSDNGKWYYSITIQECELNPTHWKLLTNLPPKPTEQ